MASARDAYDDWHEDDEPHGDAAAGWDPWPASPALSLVGQPEYGFELVRPDCFEAAQAIADSLCAGKPVVVDLHACDAGLRGRLIDFCSGLVYAVDGNLQYLGRDALLLAPTHVDVSGDEAAVVRRPGFFNRI